MLHQFLFGEARTVELAQPCLVRCLAPTLSARAADPSDPLGLTNMFLICNIYMGICLNASYIKALASMRVSFGVMQLNKRVDSSAFLT